MFIQRKFDSWAHNAEFNDCQQYLCVTISPFKDLTETQIQDLWEKVIGLFDTVVNSVYDKIKFDQRLEKQQSGKIHLHGWIGIKFKERSLNNLYLLDTMDSYMDNLKKMIQTYVHKEVGKPRVKKDVCCFITIDQNITEWHRYICKEDLVNPYPFR